VPEFEQLYSPREVAYNNIEQFVCKCFIRAGVIARSLLSLETISLVWLVFRLAYSIVFRRCWTPQLRRSPVFVARTTSMIWCCWQRLLATSTRARQI